MIQNVVFDLGGVLVDWNPRYLYRKLFNGDEASMELFLRDVCHTDWNELQDAGRTWADAIAERINCFPEHSDMIRAYFERWEEMLAGPIEGTVAILNELKAKQTPLYALSNWSAETFPIARRRFPFLQHFDGIVVSGEIRTKKPDPAIFQYLLDRYQLDPAVTVFIDDVEKNIRAAREQGLQTVHFLSPEQLRESLAAYRLL